MRHQSLTERTPDRNCLSQCHSDYTLIRPAWLDDRDEIAYGTTRKGESFANKDATVSRKSVVDLVVTLATTPGLEIRGSLGVHNA
jgi:hypothetical protein